MFTYFPAVEECLGKSLVMFKESKAAGETSFLGSVILKYQIRLKWIRTSHISTYVLNEKQLILYLQYYDVSIENHLV